MPNEIDVSIIMINYNTYYLTKDAIDTLLKFTLGIHYEIILIDNNSPDGSGERLKEIFGDKIIYIQSGGNLGTSKAFNMGLKIAKGKYVLWLNTDVLFKDNFIKKLFDFMEEHEDCGVCGGNLICKEGKPLHSFRKKAFTFKTIQRDSSILYKVFKTVFKKCLCGDYNYSQTEMEVGYITGADMFVRKEIFDKIGGLWEKIFMYAEETEFQYRVKNLTNYKIYSVPWAELIHLEGQSFNGSSFSERRHELTITGTAKYICRSFGEKELKKYINHLLRSYRKFIFISTVFCMRTKRDMYNKKFHNAERLKENISKIIEECEF